MQAIPLQDILIIPEPTSLRDRLAVWALAELDRAPAFHFGAGFRLSNADRQMIKDDVVTEFLMGSADGHLPEVRRVMDMHSSEDAEAALRFAFWKRAAQLVAQHFANQDPEWKHARRRIDLFVKKKGALTGLVSFSAFGIHFVCLESGSDFRSYPMIPRDELLTRFPLPAECLKYGHDLGLFIVQTLLDLQTGEEYRPWLSLDDLAFIVARAQERQAREPWMQESPPPIPEATDAEMCEAFLTAEICTLHWFDEQYAPRKDYVPQAQKGLRSALQAHVQILKEDSGNHPGLASLLCFYLPQLTPSTYRNSSYRKDFEYMVRHYLQELKKVARNVLLE